MNFFKKTRIMKFENMPLNLKDFVVKTVDFHHIPVSEDDEEFMNFDSYYQYPVNVDFGSEEGLAENELTIFLSLSSNYYDDVPQQGYSFLIIVESDFEVTRGGFDISDKEAVAKLVNSGLALLVAQVRGYIATITALFPEGAYYLPSIDIATIMETQQ